MKICTTLPLKWPMSGLFTNDPTFLHTVSVLVSNWAIFRFPITWFVFVVSGHC